MARIVGRQKPQSAAALRAAMGSKKFRQVSASDVDKEPQTEGPAEPKKEQGEVTRTNRKTGEVTTSSSTSGNRQAPSRQAPVQGPTLNSTDASGAGSNFDAGLAAAMGTGSSELGTSWGVAPNTQREAMEPGNFNLLYEAANGNNPYTDKKDDQMFGAQQALMMNLGGWEGNEMDDMGARYDNAGQAGGTYMTVGDVMNIVYSGGNDKQGIFKDDDGTLLNSYIFNAVSQNYSDHVLGAVDARLTQAQEEYQVASMTGKFNGTYSEWLQQTGDAEWLGAFQ